MAWTSVSSASSALANFGANPPSSPTAVDSPRFLSTAFREWKISVPARSALENVGSPLGMIMNSWKSIGASECAPPLMTFIIGTGSTLAFGPPRYLKSGWPRAAAAAWAVASETPRMAFAPSFFLLGVPSSLMSAWSISTWSCASMPHSAEAMSSLTACDGLLHALAAVAVLVAVAQFPGFVLAGGRPAGHGGAPVKRRLRGKLRLRWWGCRASRGFPGRGCR